ncbi:hypothetical protein A2422_03670 [Candidatus Woesebacteria bacterium RIFOXYC1_FULL_31_51]|uniref:DUF378 domain-containing protein n=1 Tax=Candidatus Woesebacteria bacterium GW2011_GWC2_31_9 TaxID=1618586 RepID=A0A0F9YKA7_9BACT|nr:MAG: Uncharacterized protein UR17_C0001G0353 [Candidatus Woesebacteria bacterium GW2011_GWF1_31_35]KKP23156.1 MAG: hypothetical protein UR11_C0001G0130 [Candidatus Woesebacteria bacterium GW2011_GWC1_30_29]KKP26844.1 MAG: hypothetical protein UR13_C0002G0079 [Candidatus Woesebacteria bacterium GW2011_GWD1_31_12]KKP27419.1 MAG: hypothetical protein UR16_C0003G0079 [Candidatus Woesebacteria bacterium GW2011_GWB1_31_29]KKP31698.1 MAG: hypothetical protein UR21_C0006G0013 [Candidatus Woesebacter
MKLKTISKWLVLIGAVEIGLMGIMSFDLIGSLLGSWPLVVRIVYVLIGFAGFWGIYATLTNKKKR